MSKIPKGARLYIYNTYISTVVKDLETGYLPVGLDFKPELKGEIIIENFEFRVDNKCIYKHPEFIN